MRKRIILATLAAAMLAFVNLVEAQQPKKIRRLGYLLPGFPQSALNPNVEAFRQGLRELGYVEGNNIIIEYRFAERKLGRMPALAAELVSLKVECIVTPGSPPTRAAKQATSMIPIVMTQVDDPVEEGFVTSLARPGGNITGLTNIAAELSGKRLELLKETIPKLSRVGVLWSSGPSGFRQWDESQTVARALGLQLYSMEVRSPNDLENAFKGAIKARSAALAVTATALLSANQKRIADLSTKNRLPAIYASPNYVDTGGLMAYGPNLADLYRRAAIYVDKILKGTKPADLPVERPMKFEFVINLKTAKQIGLTIPPNVLARADKVIR
jgi:ABC-type uncharacterized transport system substrate-binding protein